MNGPLVKDRKNRNCKKCGRHLETVYCLGKDDEPLCPGCHDRIYFPKGINTHEKLMKAILEGEGIEWLYTMLEFHGYRGRKDHIPLSLIWAIEDTDAYTVSSQDLRNPGRHITESEYFSILAHEINKYI